MKENSLKDLPAILVADVGRYQQDILVSLPEERACIDSQIQSLILDQTDMTFCTAITPSPDQADTMQSLRIDLTSLSIPLV